MSPDELLRVAASLDQASQHIVAGTLVSEARARRLSLPIPTETTETPGEGIVGSVEGRRVIVGGIGFVESRLRRGRGDTVDLHQLKSAGRVVVAVAVDGRAAGAIVLADDLRAGTSGLLLRLKELGIERIVLATGDRSEVALAVTAGLPIDSIRSELSPDQKVVLVLAEHKHGPVMMVGDGVNDAPALAAADLGIAMGARGAAAAAEVADVVLLVDSLERLVTAVQIARRSKGIALQSVYAGIGLSIIGMIAAAFGYVAPVQGALLQEAIDVAVILNALRALTGGASSEFSNRGED
jgi:P-type E1-E2 ATPase